MGVKSFLVRSSIAAMAASLAAPALAQPARPAPPAQPSAQTAPAADKQEVVVTGTRADVTSSPDRLSFNVANDLQVQTGTVADALRAVPGVEVDLEGRVSLRGDSGVTILIDGRPSAMLRGDNRGDVLLNMPAGQLERVEVITNPSAALSPEGSGGVINLVTKQVRKDTRSATIRTTLGPEGRGALSLNGAHSGGGLTFTGDLNYRRNEVEVAATQDRARRDPASGTFLTSSQETELQSASSFRSARFGVEYDLDKKNRLSTELNYRRGEIDLVREDQFTAADPARPFDRVSEIDLLQRGIGGRASWRRTFAKEHEFVADLEVERARLKRQVEAETIFASGAPGYELIRNRGKRGETTLKLDYKRPLGDDRSLNLGYHAELREAEFDYFAARGAAPDALLPIAGLNNAFAFDQTVHALFGVYKFGLGKLDTQLGLRLEQAETEINQITDAVRFERDYFRAYPTLHLAYELSPTQQLRASYSRRIQRPNAQDLNPYTFYVDPLNLRRGNPFLLPEVTDSFELAFQHRKGGAFYSLTGFYRRSRGGVTDILSDLGGGVFLTTRANLATAERIGVEAIANGKLGKTLSFNASATFLWNEIDARVNGLSDPRSGTTGTFRANLSWQPTPKDFIQLNGSYSGRQLLPQGFRRSGGILNFGYRRKVSERLSLLLTAQNVLDSARQVSVFETPLLRDRVVQKSEGPIVLSGLTYNLGGTNRRRQDPGFDFQQGAGDIPQ